MPTRRRRDYIVWQPEDDVFAVVDRDLFKAEAPRSIPEIVNGALMVARFNNADDAEAEAERLNCKVDVG